MAAAPAANTVTLSMTRFSGLVLRAVTTAAVAAINVRITKKCHGRNTPADADADDAEREPETEARAVSVEVAELIGETFFQLRIVSRRRRGGIPVRRRPGLRVRPLARQHHRANRADRTDEIRQRPGQPIEPLVDRRRERL